MAKPRQEFPTELLITPDPFVPQFKILIQRNSTTGVTGLYYSQDSGATYKLFLPLPGSQDRAGAFLTLNEDLTASWKQFVLPTILTKRLPVPIEMQQVGALEAGDIFGYFKVSAGLTLSLSEIQLCLQNAANANVQIDVVNGSNVVQERVAVILSGNKTGATVLSTPLRMNAGTVWKLKVLACGTGSTPGENLTARLILNGV